MRLVLTWACCCSWQATFSTAFKLSSQHQVGTHDLAFDRHGKLVFSQQGRAAADAELQSVYSVHVNFDHEAMDTAKGMTMKFDKVNHAMRLDTGIAPADGLAWGRYADSINTNGWSELYMDTTTNAGVSNDVSMYSAGYIEGVMTCVRLSEHHYNVHKLLLRTEATKHALANVKASLKDQIAFMKQRANMMPHIMAEEPKDDYWKHSRFVLFQLWGLLDGYNYASKHFGTNKFALEDLLVLNIGGELSEMVEAYTPKAAQERASAKSFASMSFLQRGRQQDAGKDMRNVKVHSSRLLQSLNASS